MTDVNATGNHSGTRPASGLQADLLAFMAQPDSSEEAFNHLALRLFAYQFQHNHAYHQYCRQQRKTVRTVRRWQDIPAVPVDAFKLLTLSSTPVDECARVFTTSGTTSGSKGSHYHADLGIYDYSMQLNFQQRFMGEHRRIRMGILFPDESAMPNSSLAHYLALAARKFGTGDSACFIGQDGIDVAGLCQAMQQAQQDGRPYALLGASYSFVHLMDALDEQGLRFRLPAGSRLLDTGGFKGQSRALEPAEFYRRLETCFGVPVSHCINMYGMTELSTQFYDGGNEQQPAIKSGPHWIRTRLIDPASGVEVPHGERGILVHCDLANLNSVSTIMTEDAGFAVDNGFILEGRAQGAHAKGCSMVMDAFLQAVEQ